MNYVKDDNTRRLRNHISCQCTKFDDNLGVELLSLSRQRPFLVIEGSIIIDSYHLIVVG